jgi:NADH-quinone oxidoreductase subunit H
MEQLYIDLENYLGIGTDSVPDVVLLAIAVLALGTIFLLAPILTIWVERKVAARFQNRIGPNRTGPFGLLQSLADVLKLIGKEQIMPAHADRIPFLFAPMLMVVSVIMITAVIPLMPNYIGSDLSIGALYFVAISSLTTISVIMAGWGSNNKYALLGAFRTVAQLISYEIPLVFSLLVPVLFAGTMSMVGITEAQANLDYWYIFLAPASFLIFLFSNLAEIGRTPFDLIEAESELVAGYQIEYSAMPWGMFMLSEFLHAFLVGPIVAVLFLGGWDGPFVRDLPILGVVYLVIKSLAVYFLGMWMRATLPRFRIDQLMAFNWKFLVPLSIANLLIAAFLWELFPEPSGGGLIDNFPRFVVLGGSSLFTLGVALEFLRRKSVEERERIARLIDEKHYPLATADQTGAAGD